MVPMNGHSFCSALLYRRLASSGVLSRVLSALAQTLANLKSCVTLVVAPQGLGIWTLGLLREDRLSLVSYTPPFPRVLLQRQGEGGTYKGRLQTRKKMLLLGGKERYGRWATRGV